jgi:hypothetical protein
MPMRVAMAGVSFGGEALARGLHWRLRLGCGDSSAAAGRLGAGAAGNTPSAFSREDEELLSSDRHELHRARGRLAQFTAANSRTISARPVGAMFSIAQRDALRERVLRLGEDDDRVVAGAVVGSLALGDGDRFSDLDLTFAVADHATVADVLDDWTRALVDEDDAVQLVDLEHGPTVYRVLLLDEALQFDLSMTPAARFRPGGPRFRLVFGETVADEPEAPARPGSLFIPTPAIPHDIFGWGVVYALHGRSCIERGRLWQAEHCVDAVRDHALSLACLREGAVAVQARGYDDLSAESLARFTDAHVGAVEPGALRAALAASVLALVHEGTEAGLPHADVVAGRLAELH